MESISVHLLAWGPLSRGSLHFCTFIIPGTKNVPTLKSVCFAGLSWVELVKDLLQLELYLDSTSD